MRAPSSAREMQVVIVLWLKSAQLNEQATIGAMRPISREDVLKKRIACVIGPFCPDVLCLIEGELKLVCEENRQPGLALLSAYMCLRFTLSSALLYLLA